MSRFTTFSLGLLSFILSLTVSGCDLSIPSTGDDTADSGDTADSDDTAADDDGSDEVIYGVRDPVGRDERAATDIASPRTDGGARDPSTFTEGSPRSGARLSPTSTPNRDGSGAMIGSDRPSTGERP